MSDPILKVQIMSLVACILPAAQAYSDARHHILDQSNLRLSDRDRARLIDAGDRLVVALTALAIRAQQPEAGFDIEDLKRELAMMHGLVDQVIALVAPDRVPPMQWKEPGVTLH